MNNLLLNPLVTYAIGSFLGACVGFAIGVALMISRELRTKEGR